MALESDMEKLAAPRAAKFDVVCFLPSEDKAEMTKRVKTALTLLRELTDDEKIDARARFGDLTNWVNTFLGPSGNTHGWAKGYYDEATQREFMMLPTIARAYWGAPEFLPKDFKWERLKTPAGFFGGTLIDAKKRRKP